MLIILQLAFFSYVSSKKGIFVYVLLIVSLSLSLTRVLRQVFFFRDEKNRSSSRSADLPSGLLFEFVFHCRRP